ncbi:MAG: hypothetical protein KJO33_14980 [Gammaproteobacteria bacterium]|nr:hypothetical protein [Gammaproteobacteria bacterium]
MTSRILLLLLPLLWAVAGACLAQDDSQPGDTDGSSEQVESSDDAYRRRMELEDARRQDPSYTDPIDTYKKDLEKIDKLPEESRDNIRDQLVDVIVENGEWEPSDALDEYPYEPTEAAKKDPVLMEQEQEAWDEQVEKYHEREAAAFGTYRGPVPGPGNPSGQQGGGQAGQTGQGSGEDGGQGGSGQGGSGEGNGGGSGTAGTYQAGGSNGDDDSASTAGVSESALDFLRGRQGQSSAGGGSGGPGETGTPAGSPGQGSGAGESSPGTTGMTDGSGSPGGSSGPGTDGARQSAAEWAAQEAAAAEQAAETGSETSTAEQASQAAESQAEEAAEEMAEQTPDIDLDTRGIIAIEDLDKLEGTVTGERDPEEEDR